ncbi:Protein phosphatase Slingshot like protein 2 [Habropoda laboriosa]|uniref:Protein phosphatase Slingshot like protein 2 n=1 Tax=Habropoda laboriosa TaxID=597456 RepID=A0A0L7R152_9HYME|nr:Protein phosphatase Slingshot like protein 2 [Habropoda laboriosa]
MFYLLRPEETLKMAVKLESVHPGRTRYLVVVSCTGRQDAEESCLLGIDCHARATVGLVLRVLADTAITLDGDGYVHYFPISPSLRIILILAVICVFVNPLRTIDSYMRSRNTTERNLKMALP